VAKIDLSQFNLKSLISLNHIFTTMHVTWTLRLNGISGFEPSESIPLPVGGRIKRITDVVVSVFLCLLFSPLLLGTALTIKVLEGGPVLFAHRRIGFDRKQFYCWKFRTMVPQADQLLTDYLASDEKAAAEWVRSRKLKDDPRVTRLGKVLRETSLDELPQLLNVIKGDMSLVGPRPIVPNEAIKYGRRLQKYAAARPGMTGLWQVSGRSELSFRRRVALDVNYVTRYSFAGDVAIALRTFPAVILRIGSY
jgi:exopolysaccharide production protein ExoY